MPADRRALLVATYGYRDTGLRQLTAPAHDAEALAEVLQDPAIAGFDVTMLVNEPHHVVGEAIADFYAGCRRDDLTLLYFTGHGLKDDDGRLYLATTDTRRDALMFTALSAAQVSDAMDACRSRRKVLVLDCCYSGAFPAGRLPKSDEGVQTLERFQGKGRAVLTASDATQYSFEGDQVRGSGARSLFTHHLVEAIRTGEADLDGDGDITLDELYSHVRERVVAEMPQQRPKKQEDVDGRIVIARNVHWRLPEHLQHAIESPISGQRLGAADGLAHLHRVGNELVRATVLEQLTSLAEDDSRSVSARAQSLLQQLRGAPLVDAPDGAQPAAAPSPGPRAAPDPAPRPAPDPTQRREPHPAAHLQVGTEDGAPGRAPAPLLPWLVVLTGVALVVSRLVVFEATNGYRAASVGFGTVPWLLGIGLPVLGAAVLLTAPVGSRAQPVVAGLLVGAAVCVTDQALTSVAYVADYGYVAGPGWWVAAVALLLLLVCAVRAAPAPDSWRAPAPRADWAAVLGLVVVLGGWAVWTSRFYPDRGLWVPALAPAVLLAVGCLPLAVLVWDDAQRWAGLTAVTVYGAYLVATQVDLIVTDSVWTDAPDAVAAIASAVVMVSACHLAQRLGRRSRPSPVPRA